VSIFRREAHKYLGSIGTALSQVRIILLDLLSAYKKV
jgi:hypothetical protein